MLTKILKPVIEIDLITLSNDTELLREMFEVIKSGIEMNQKMNDYLFQFCKENNLNTDFNNFDQTEFDHKILELESLINERN